MARVNSDENLTQPGTCSEGAETYLFMSDFHLGSDLVSHARPWAHDTWLRDAPEGDDALVSLVEHYRASKARVNLVFVGDFLDLVGVSLPVGEDRVSTPPTAEERRHGLGSPADHVVLKIRAIGERHRPVFEALGRFVRSGHRVVVVCGNHDVELHWRAARRALTSEIVGDAPHAPGQVEICPWFYAVPGLFYAEHGHGFDAMCSYGDPLLPTSQGDSRRIRAAPFSSMLRYVARPTRGLSTASYENVSFGTYLRLLLRFGVRGTAGIAIRFARAVWGLVSEWFCHAQRPTPRRTLRVQAAHQRFARHSALSADALPRLRALHTLPATHSLWLVFRLLYIDRVLKLCAAFASIATSAVCARFDAPVGMVLALVAALVLSYRAVQERSRSVCARTPMRRGADEIAQLTGARFVLMGHTHTAERCTLRGGASYVNLGHWGEDDIPEERAQSRARSPRTYFQLRSGRAGVDADFLQWDELLGARTYHPLPVDDVAPALPPEPLAERPKRAT